MTTAKDSSNAHLARLGRVPSTGCAICRRVSIIIQFYKCLRHCLFDYVILQWGLSVCTHGTERKGAPDALLAVKLYLSVLTMITCWPDEHVKGYICVFAVSRFKVPKKTLDAELRFIELRCSKLMQMYIFSVLTSSLAVTCYCPLT